VADAATGARMSAATRTDVGSVAKQLTAAIVFLLADAGALSLADPITDHLPSLAAGPARAYASAVTVRHLVYHASGLREVLAVLQAAGDAGLARELPPGALLAAIARQAAADWSPPGARWAYANTNYLLLAAIVERVTGEPFAAAARRLLFAPLGMKDTVVWGDARGLYPTLASSYTTRVAIDAPGAAVGSTVVGVAEPPAPPGHLLGRHDRGGFGGVGGGAVGAPPAGGGPHPRRPPRRPLHAPRRPRRALRWGGRPLRGGVVCDPVVGGGRQRDG